VINETPEGKLAEYLIGDLAVARRHLERIRTGDVPQGLMPAVIAEISQSIEDCIRRIQRDLK
jgi:hypothetical protein